MSRLPKRKGIMMATGLINGMLYSGVAIALFVGTMLMVMGMAAEK